MARPEEKCGPTIIRPRKPYGTVQAGLRRKSFVIKTPAFRGCNELFLLGPNALNQTQLEVNAVEAATAVGVRHIVKQSVLGADEEAFIFARIHRPVEKAIESSGIAWTFLRPNSFMQNVVTFMGGTIRSEAAFYSASGEARISHVMCATSPRLR
jgi:uncharacterized protein YbjT (DUF2867 family)